MGARARHGTPVAVLLAVGLLACAPSGSAPAQTGAAPSAGQAAAAAPTAAALEKVVVSTSDPGIVFSPMYVGIAKGFFREEGLDPDVQVLKTDASLAALATNQDVDYQSTIGTVSRGAATGLPVKVVNIWFEKIVFYVMARPEITSIQDLKGKVVGITTFGATTDIAMRQVLKEAGFEPQTDVSIIQLGPGNGRIGAITAGGAVASLFTPPDDIIAEEQGLHRVPASSEALPFPFSGFGVSDKRLQDNPGQVQRMLRASLKTVRFMREQHREASDIIADATGSERDMTFRAYETMIGTLSPDGWASGEALNGQLETSVAPGTPVPPESQLFDPRPLKAAQQTLGISGRP